MVSKSSLPSCLSTLLPWPHRWRMLSSSVLSSCIGVLCNVLSSLHCRNGDSLISECMWAWGQLDLWMHVGMGTAWPLNACGHGDSLSFKLCKCVSLYCEVLLLRSPYIVNGRNITPKSWIWFISLLWITGLDKNSYCCCPSMGKIMSSRLHTNKHKIILTSIDSITPLHVYKVVLLLPRSFSQARVYRRLNKTLFKVLVLILLLRVLWNSL